MSEKNVFLKKIIKENPDKYPAKLGNPWTEKDDKLLFDLIDNNKSINEIAQILQRTNGGIYGRLKRFALSEFDEGEYIEDIQKKIKIKSISDISKWVEKDEPKNDNNIISKKKISSNSKDYIFELNDRITKIENKLGIVNNNQQNILSFDYLTKKYTVVDNQIYIIDDKNNLAEYIGKYNDGNIKIKREIYYKIKNIILKNIINIDTNEKDNLLSNIDCNYDDKEYIEEDEFIENDDKLDIEDNYETINYEGENYYLDGKKVYKIKKDKSKGKYIGKYKNNKIKFKESNIIVSKN